MTLLDAQQYDEARARRRRNRIVIAVIVVLIGVWIAYHFRYYPERRVAARFFEALQKQQFETAYAIWQNDPNWKQHPNKYPNYGYGDFFRDWGTGGEWGIVKSYSIDCSLAPGSGVIVQVTVNSRSDHAYVWVQKSDKTMSFSPSEIQCGNWFAWLTE
jgi:hypothetical protein